MFVATVALGLDLGTSGVRVLAVNDKGKVIAEVNRHYPLLTPQPGWTEQNPSDWAKQSLLALKDMAKKLKGHTLVGLGLSGQMHGMTPLDAQGKVVRPAILWNDQRTGDAVKLMEKTVPRKEFIQRTGNPAITGFHISKLVWLRKAEPDNFKRAKHSLLPKDYIGYVLTGQMASEPTDNSGTNCFHLASKAWDTDILKELKISPSLFPTVIASHDIIGKLTRTMARQTGLPEGLPVIAGAGDNAAAATGLGLSSRKPTLGSVSLGTSGVIFAPLREATPDPEGRVHLFCHADGGYNLLGVTLSAAGSLQWYHDTFTKNTSFKDLVKLAAKSKPGANGVTFKPYLAGERTPHLNPDLRGSFTGLSLATNEADVVQAVLEGVTFSLHDALDVINSLTRLTSCLSTGGGSQSDFWLQMISDVLKVPLSTPTYNQGAAYGAALLALKGVGVTSDTTKLVDTTIASKITPKDAKVYKTALERYHAVPLN
ncbi:MAG: xylulokinase [Trueperaceae bacterium]